MRSIVATAVALVGLAGASWAQAQSPDAARAPAGACAGAEFRQFDFWLGDWDTFDMAAPTKVVARNKVTRMLHGCALREDYVQNDGLVGESYSLWDASRKRWHQSWVTNRGTLLLLEGGMEGDRMVMAAPETQPDGSTSLLRGVWWRDGVNVRSKAERSTDGGKTWSPVFDIVFRPHRAGAGG